MGNGLSIAYRFYTQKRAPPAVPKEKEGVLRMGIVGAAKIAPEGLIWPALDHSEVQVCAVASRDKARGEALASKHGVPTVYHGSEAYQELVDDPSLDAVYIALPNGLHFEWTMKALKAGKHVLLEKPGFNNAAEAKEAFAYAEERGVILLEAFHTRFHPAMSRVRDLVNSGELGKIKSSIISFRLGNMWPDDDIRYDINLGGGTLMDLGGYALTVTRFVLDRDPTQVIEARANPFSDAKSKVDLRTTATLQFPDDIVATIDVEYNRPHWGPFGLLPHMPELSLTCHLEGGEIELSSIFPGHWHTISIKPKDGKTRKEYAYAYKDAPAKQKLWSSYRYQLEAFVDKLKGREPRAWVSAEDTIKNMEAIDMIYEKTGLGPRPTIFHFVK